MRDSWGARFNATSAASAESAGSPNPINTPPTRPGTSDRFMRVQDPLVSTYSSARKTAEPSDNNQLFRIFGLKHETTIRRYPSNPLSGLLTSTAIAMALPTLLDGKALSQEVQAISFRFSDPPHQPQNVPCRRLDAAPRRDHLPA